MTGSYPCGLLAVTGQHSLWALFMGSEVAQSGASRVQPWAQVHYGSAGEPTDGAGWWGNFTLFQCLWRICALCTGSGLHGANKAERHGTSEVAAESRIRPRHAV